MSDNEQFMKPTRSIIGDTLYTQYVELQQKQITEWNQLRKKKMDVPASIKHKDSIKVKKGASGTIEAKLDRMIRWMQEIGLVLQEFARMNWLCAPSYPLDMFKPTLTHQNEGANLEEKGATQEYPETKDEYEAAFLLQFSTLKGH
ncbi:hypothetical protein Godav_006096, partial [Gossypium davidsonii]|nr:hypothetical protein [Gossypium davidsonii]MBA0655780.1 hypothetical protein [Gossypium klotzschianum]